MRRVSSGYPLWWNGRWNRIQCRMCFEAGLKLWSTQTWCSECARRVALGRDGLFLSPLPKRRLA